MKVEDLLDLSVRDLLDKYCILYNPECGYFYGVTTWDNAYKMYNEYNIEEEYPESMCTENMINDEIWFDDELIDMKKIDRIMDNLGINKKTKNIEREKNK